VEKSLVVTQLRDTLVLHGVNNMTYAIALLTRFCQHGRAPKCALYAAYKPISNYTFQQRAIRSERHFPTIYVTLLSGRPRQDHLDGRSRTAQ
jgi:hypothetical protein